MFFKPFFFYHQYVARSHPPKSSRFTAPPPQHQFSPLTPDHLLAGCAPGSPVLTLSHCSEDVLNTNLSTFCHHLSTPQGISELFGWPGNSLMWDRAQACRSILLGLCALSICFFMCTRVCVQILVCAGVQVHMLRGQRAISNVITFLKNYLILFLRKDFSLV